MNLQHAIERHPRPALGLVGHDDLVVDRALEQPFEDPEQVVRRHAEHRRAQAAERIERHDRAVGRELVRQAVDQMDLGGDGPDRSRPGSCAPSR